MARFLRCVAPPLLALWTAALTALCPAPAAAARDEAREEPPVAALIPFGARLPADAAVLAAQCEAALGRMSGLRILPPARWRKEADESGEGADLEAMAKRLGADVLVTGTLSGSGAAQTLSIDVFNEQGLPLGSFALPVNGPQLGPASAFLLADGLARLIQPAVGLPPPAPFPIIAAQPEPTPQTEDRERPIEDLLRRQREAARPKPVPPRPPWRAIIEGQLSGLATGRSLGCGPASEARRNLQCGQAVFPFDFGGGVKLGLTFFPFALRRSWPASLTGLGVTASVDLPLWADRQSTAGSTLPVQQLRAEGGLWWRLAFGAGTNKPAIELGVLYGYHKFSLSGGLRPPPFPDAEYQTLVPTAGIGVFLGDRLYLRAHLAYLAVLSTGPLLDGSADNPFGTGSALGFRGTALFDVRLYRKLLLTLGVSAEQVRMSLDGNGCRKTDPNQTTCLMPPTPVPAISDASDLHVSGWLGLGFRL